MAFMLVIHGRDNWKDSWLDRIESAANGKIQSCQDDGVGKMVFQINSLTSKNKKSRRETMKRVQREVGHMFMVFWKEV